jgi:hypothetical protein
MAKSDKFDKPDKPTRGGDKNPKSPKKLSGPKKTPSDSPLTAQQLAANKEKGFLQWSGRGKMPQPDIYVEKSPGVQERLCFGHCTKGRACRFGTACNYYHCNDPTKLKPATQTRICEWVESTSGLAFVPGAPHPTTGTN